MKKREVKPFVDSVHKDTITKLSFLTGLSIKTIGEDLCNHAIKSNFAFNLAPHFKRSVKIKKVQFGAQPNPLPVPKNKAHKLERMSLMLNEQVYEYAFNLHYATDISIPKIIAAMIDFSMKDTNFFDKYVTEYLSEQIDPERKKILKSIIKDINGELEDKQTVAALLFYIAEEYKEVGEGVGESVEKFVSQWTVAEGR